MRKQSLIKWKKKYITNWWKRASHKFIENKDKPLTDRCYLFSQKQPQSERTLRWKKGHIVVAMALFLRYG